MRILIFIVLILLGQAYAFAFQTPDTVRVRTFKDLNQWPQINGAKIQELNAFAWSATGSNLTFHGKKLSTHNVILKKGLNFEIVSVFNFPQYLAGVVASEMPVSWPMEALKAQAVVARSFTLAKLNEKSRGYYDMESDENDQMFSVTASSKAVTAVLETEDVVLSDTRGKPLKAYYHSDCGGETVKARDVWGGNGFETGTAKDPWCASRPSARWNFEIAKSDFFKKLGLQPQASFTGKLNWAGRSQIVELFGESFSVQKLRQIFGFSKLKSTPSEIEIGLKTVVFKGQGFGHGSGLCQWGTKSQASAGTDYRDILIHYYPNAVLTMKKPKIAVVTLPKGPLLASTFDVSK